MKILSQEELAEKAQGVFELNPSYAKVYVTEDGEVFGPDADNYAKLHAREQKLQVQTFERNLPPVAEEVTVAVTDTETGGALTDADKSELAGLTAETADSEQPTETETPATASEAETVPGTVPSETGGLPEGAGGQEAAGKVTETVTVTEAATKAAGKKK